MTPSERFWKGIDVKGPDECWPLLGCDSVKWGGKMTSKRRVAWELTNGPIPRGKLVLLSCGNGSCCNPSHEFLGAYAERNAVMAKMGRSTKGERNIHAKLTEDDVREIRRLRATQGLNAKQLSERFNISKTVCIQIWNRQSWTHVE